MMKVKAFLLNDSNVERNSYIWNMSGSMLVAFQSVIMLMILTRVLGLVEAGILTIAYANANLFQNIGKYGMRNFQVSDVKDEFNFSEYKASRIVTAIAMVAVSFIYVIYTAKMCIRDRGKAILKKLVQSGVNVWACMRKKDEELEEEFQKFAEENDVWIKPVYMDLSSEESVKNAAKEILSEKRKIDILVNNAGIAFAGTLSMTPMSRVRETFEVNFFAMLALIQMISKQMRRNRDFYPTSIVSLFENKNRIIL